MLLIECPICDRRELRGTGSIARLENTSSGIIATVRCSGGHLHQMTTGIARPVDDADTPVDGSV